MATAFCVGSLANVLWYFAIGNFKTILIFCYLLPSIILAILIFMFIRDTPICLVTKNTAKKAYDDLMYIAKMNGKADENNLSIESIL